MNAIGRILCRIRDKLSANASPSPALRFERITATPHHLFQTEVKPRLDTARGWPGEGNQLHFGD
jgi:hypothetical protein